MNKENKKRKNIPLSKSEWLGFFFLPVNISSDIFRTKDFNDEEEERYEKFGFDRKLSQSKKVRKLGIAFYVLIIFVIFLIRSLL